MEGVRGSDRRKEGREEGQGRGREGGRRRRCREKQQQGALNSADSKHHQEFAQKTEPQKVANAGKADTT